LARQLTLPKELEHLIEKRVQPDRRKRNRRQSAPSGVDAAEQGAVVVPSRRKLPDRRKQARRRTGE